MSKIDFDARLNRYGTDSCKWDAASGSYGVEIKYPFWVADMDFAVPDEVTEAIKTAAEQRNFGYSIDNAEYGKAVCGWYNRRFGTDYEPDWLIHTPGVVTILRVCVDAFTEPGDGIIVLHPIYTPFPKVIEEAGRRELPVYLKKADNGYRTIDFEALDKAAESAEALMFCNPHNPVSRVWTREELTKVVEICKKHNLLIFSDEIHIDLTSPDYPATPILTVCPEYNDRIIAATSPSKTFNIPDFEDSNAIIPNKELRERYIASKSAHWLPGHNVIVMRAVRAAYNYGDEWVDGLQQYLKGNEQAVRSYFAEKLPEVKLTPWEGTYLLWLDCTALGKGVDELNQALLAQGVRLMPGTSYYAEGEVCFRINMATQRDFLLEGCEAIVRAFKG